MYIATKSPFNTYIHMTHIYDVPLYIIIGLKYLRSCTGSNNNNFSPSSFKGTELSLKFQSCPKVQKNNHFPMTTMTGTASLKPCLWPVPDTECQV